MNKKNLDKTPSTRYSGNMAKPMHKIKLQKGDLIIVADTGNSYILVERLKKEGRYHWATLNTRTGSRLLFKEISLRHNLWTYPHRYKISKKKS